MKISRAFTLIELLIVVAIIAILAAIAVPNFLEAQTRSKVSRAKADMRSIATGLEAYAVDYQRTPPWFVPVQSGGIFLQGAQQIHLITTPVAYMSSIPQDVFQAGKPVTSTNANKNYSAFLGPYPNYFIYTDRYATQGSFKLNGAEGWSVRVMGPDTDFDLVGDTNDGDTAIPENGVYDPTNGTISNGDVIRSGGGIQLVSE
ncbi:MAG: hypothetical protein PWP23_1534 [Candidatus Sumerlaeota bacterium]|nr:hypothetical protein [Candidatus Sumerlaeota bacterium]